MIVEKPHEQKTVNQIYPSPPLILASRFKRWLASIINAMLLYLIILIGVQLGKLSSIILIFIYLAWQLYFIKKYRQTLAKRWLSLKVVDYQTRNSISLTKYILRELLDYTFSLFGVMIIISAIAAFVNNEKRSLTDIIMSTIVVNESMK
ncbi:RDD family protein [Rodentibacter caecimuris]|uniref:RDD domain-containing protein n=1 Tax=Rodentibacter caecimuris TaxID=1796644 RepID=A0ABX3KW98_9PAST|nr:hypothetical protein BKG89_07160 [Rodentibacter heylii]